MRIQGNVVNTYVHMDLIVEESSYSTENNSSVVAWQLVGYLGSGATSAHWYSNSYHTIAVNINGNTVYSRPNTTSQLISIGTDRTQANPLVIASGSVTVPHNADGTKNCSCSFSCSYRYNAAFTWNGSGNLSLTSIPRATVPTTGTSSAYVGGQVVISTPRASSSFTHTLSYSIAGVVTGNIASNVGTSYTWTVPSSIVGALNNLSSGNCTIYCTTYQNGQSIGTKSCTIKINIPTSTFSFSAANAYLGQSIDISINRISSNLEHRIDYVFGNSSGTIATYVGSSTTWNIPISLAAAISDHTGGTATLTLTTYNGTAKIGTKTATIDIYVPVVDFTFSASSATMGGSVNVNFSTASTIQCRLDYSFVNDTGTIGTYLTGNTTWNVPLNLANQIPASTSGTATLTLTTYNGLARVGTKTHSIRLNVPSSVVPTISNIATSDPNGYLSRYGDYVQGYSKCKATVTAAGAYGSSITNYTITIDGGTYKTREAISGILNTSGSKTISVTVTDSRNRTATSTKTINVLAYTMPTISTFKINRCNASGTTDEDGEYFKVVAAASITALNNHNSKSFVIQYKLSNASSWTNIRTYTAGYSLSSTDIVHITTENSYNVRIVVTDDFKESVKTNVIPTVYTLVDFHHSGKGISFGKVAENENLFDLNIPFYSSQNGRIANGRRLFGTKSNGTETEILDVCNAENNTYLGYGHYSEKNGNTNLCGYDVNLYVSNAASNVVFRPYYRKGDSVAINVYTAGYCSSGAAGVYFIIPLDKPIIGNPNISAASTGGFVLRQEGKYTHGSAAGAGITPSSMTVSAVSSGLLVSATFSATTNAINNAAIGIQWTGNITFS